MNRKPDQTATKPLLVQTTIGELVVLDPVKCDDCTCYWNSRAYGICLQPEKTRKTDQDCYMYWELELWKH